MTTTLDATETRTRRDTRSPRVLLVEDDGDLRVALAGVLRGRALDVIEVADGREALELMSGEGCDVLISDIRLPGLSGMTIARSAHSLKSPPRVILITAYPDWRVCDEAVRVGVSKLLLKPLDIHAFADVVTQVALSAMAAPEMGMGSGRAQGDDAEGIC